MSGFTPWSPESPPPLRPQPAGSKRMGWECPKCHRTYAPWFPRCDRCDLEVTAEEEGA